LGALPLGFDRTRTLRGAVAGAVAAAVWAVQQPLDKLAFGCRYDDVELLGRAFARGEGWYPLGLALHMGDGAAFGSLYANLAPTLPLPAMLRGPAAALTEHAVLWPAVRLTDRLHPARHELPKLSGSRRAYAQAVWRHLLFGVVLGELERRLNAVPEPVPPAPEPDYSSNGRGHLEGTVTVSGSAPDA
jgi:hypothetical protein